MRLRRSQSGAALILLAAILVMGFAGFLYATLNARLNETARTRNLNAEVLEQAKTALIGYVAKKVLDLTETVPGRLPCPESPGFAGGASEGQAAASCAPGFPSNKTVGRFPWRTVGADRLVDANGEPLWYAVSPNWVLDGGTAPIINSGTTGQLSVDGVSDVVAVIIAPGAALNTTPNSAQAAQGCFARVQRRDDRSHVATSSTNPDFRDYLECENATATPDAAFGSAIVDNATNPVINDQLVYVTSRDILNAIQGPLAERLQKTVAPLLSEYSTSWVSGGTILPAASNTTLPRLLPYAFPFTPPESGTARQAHCGSASTPTREGLLPVADTASTTCPSPWSGFTWAGSVGGTSCTTGMSGAVTCQFTYYTLRSINFPIIGPLNLFELLGIAPPATTAVTLQATAPYAASTFRQSLEAADFAISPIASVQAATFTQAPNPANGGADLTITLQVSGSQLCENRQPPQAPFNLVCSTLGTLGDVCALIPVLSPFCGLLGSLLNQALTTPHVASISFPALADPMLQGSQLSASVMSGVSTPINLLNPSTDAPHYWFVANEWYRYTYYAISPNASASGVGGELTVNGFPAEFGNANDKRFVLAIMGPPVTGQVRGTAAALSQYVEGDNADTAATPRAFAYQVFTASGNDRLAACPFGTGAATVCN